MADPKGPPRVHLKSKRLEFYARVRAGESVSEAAAGVGVAVTLGSKWLRKCGGVLPPQSRREPRYRRLSIEEREKILAGMAREDSIREIARSIGRAPSTVKREIDANLIDQRYTTQQRGGPGRGGRPRTREWRYFPHRAQRRAERNAARSTPAKLAVNAELRQEVQTRLQEEHSPEQVAHRLRRDFPDRPEMWVSHETIYQSLYVQGRGALRRDLHKRLRTGRALRKPHRKSDERRGRIPGMVSITERPAEVEDRAVPGHWEGDLIMGSMTSNSAIGTLVERTTRYLLLLHLPRGHGADAVAEGMVEAMSRLPEQLRQTLTWDQGKEMRNHAQIAAATDLDIYFCDPHSPWQRGTNENTNGLLRQYFPKGTDLSVYQPDYLDHVARKLNTRPRKTLDWRTPAEKLDELLSNPTNPHGVALAG